MNKVIVAMVVFALLAGCIKINEEKVPSLFKTDEFRVGDRITYELWGKMVVQTDTGFLIYTSRGTAEVEIKKGTVEDGAGNTVEVVDFYMSTDETPYNQTSEKEALPVALEKHVYRLYDGEAVGGIVKSVTMHHAYNRERKLEVNCPPINDITDVFLQRELNASMSGNFDYENMTFTWIASYDKNLKALRINVTANTSMSYVLWIRNGYPLPYQVMFKNDDGTRSNTYTFTLKKFKRGSGERFGFGSVAYDSERDVAYYRWKDFGAPWHGNGSSLKMNLQAAMVKAHDYAGLKQFLRDNPDSYMVYAEYWETADEAGWNLHFGNKNLKKEYVLNVSNAERTPIPSEEISQYLAFKDLPKDLDNISDEMISVAEAESIFEEKVDYRDENHSFRISFIEVYYPDTLFDIWEGNSKEKEISEGYESRGAILIDGFHQLVKEYAFGYWLVIPNPPFNPSEWKINGENGTITYIYEESS